MAAIGSIRKHSVILIVIVGVAMLAFILGDLGKNQGNAKLQDKFIQVGKDKISYNQYMHDYNAYRDLIKIREDRNLSSEEDFEVGNQVFETMVDSLLLARESNALGISVTAEELRDLVAGANPHRYAQQFFSPNGTYDMQLANNFLDNMDQYDTNARNQYMELERYIERETLVNKYFNLISKSFYMPQALLRKAQEESLLKADVEVVQVSYSDPSVSDEKISVTQDEIKNWYDSNKYRFKQDKEYRDVEYVIFRIEPSPEDLETIENEVNQLFTEFSTTDRPQDFVNRLIDSRYDSTYFKQGELAPSLDTILFNAPVGTLVAPYIDGNMWTFAKLLDAKNRPDSINVSLMFVADKGTQQAARTKAEADSIVDLAYNAVKGGMNFYEASVNYSDIPVEGQPDSAKIWLVDGTEGQFFFDTLYNLAPGSIVKYKNDNIGGTYIFRINEVTAPSRKIQVAIGKKEIAASQETIDNIESRANTFMNGLTTISEFDKKAEANGLDKRSFERVEPMTYTLPGVTNGGRDIIQWIYDKKTKLGDVSTVFSTGEVYVVVALKGIYPEGYLPLDQEQVKQYCETMAKRDKKSSVLEAALNKQVKAGKSLDAIASSYNTEKEATTVSFIDRNLSHFGPEAKIIGSMLGQKQGTTQVYGGEMGVYVVKVNKVDVPTVDVKTDTETINMMSQQQSMMFQNRVQQTLTPSLRKMVKVVDNRPIVM